MQHVAKRMHTCKFYITRTTWNKPLPGSRIRRASTTLQIKSTQDMCRIWIYGTDTFVMLPRVCLRCTEGDFGA